MTRIGIRMIRIIVLGGLVAAILTAVGGGLVGKFRLLVVTSGSMEPAIPAGSLIALIPKDNYASGDIISFNEAGDKVTTTHRISQVEEIDGRIRYVTKGDRNEEEDLSLVYFNKVVGKVVVVIPKFGKTLLAVNQFSSWVEEMISRAFLSDQESSVNNSLAAGTMDLKISDDDEAAGDSLAMTWEGDNLRPGQETAAGELKIKNAGTVAADHIHISVENLITQGAGPGADAADPMDANLEIQALQYNEADIKSYLSDKNGNGIIDLDDWEQTPIAEFSLPLTDLNNNHTLSLTVSLRSETSETNQGDVVTTAFSIIGHQLSG